MPSLTPTLEFELVTGGNLATRRQLVADAQALARDANGATDPKAINEILIAWANTEPAGSDHDGRLWWELKEACASFYERSRPANALQPVDPERNTAPTPPAERCRPLGAPDTSVPGAGARTRAPATAHRVTQHLDASVRPRRLPDKSRLATKLHPPVNPGANRLITR